MTVDLDDNAHVQSVTTYAIDRLAGTITQPFKNLSLSSSWTLPSRLVLLVTGPPYTLVPRPSQACVSSTTLVPGASLSSSSCLVLGGNFAEFVPVQVWDGRYRPPAPPSFLPKPSYPVLGSIRWQVPLSTGLNVQSAATTTRVFLFSKNVVTLYQGTVASLKFMAFSSTSRVTGSMTNVHNVTASTRSGARGRPWALGLGVARSATDFELRTA